ncbi:hypothetical protein J8I87_07130 [Paraburkholderia sp. LEh10]|jgi:hypothetical protein|uniref:hypothetical protein n=1 Tax=Paraburkholderia sp. LEh10 TaxID=2821353 RepID=UPI001AE3AD71|nr:hypothetical protein [Paraburkholderia sp. LEh10]MBP0589494.1 hypothetical protein [Paraburkholderia sp. LEh10]
MSIRSGASSAIFTLAGYTGYANLIHVKPSVTLKPTMKRISTLSLGVCMSDPPVEISQQPC